MRGRKKGAVTLEAALIMPAVLYFFINILSVFDILRVQCAIEASLHQTGNELCLAAFDLKLASSFAGEGEMSVPEGAAGLLTLPYVSSKTRDSLTKSGVSFSCVEGGADGISFLRSVPGTNGDIIELHADYRVRPLLKVFPFMEFPVTATYYAHAWTGYDITGETGAEDETEYVFITPTGTVYHRSMECTHLRLSIRETSIASLESERSRSGAVYHPCERCASGRETGRVYVTDYGNRYHSALTCSGLKRTIYTVPLEEAGGRGPCSKCGR